MDKQFLNFISIYISITGNKIKSMLWVYCKDKLWGCKIMDNNQKNFVLYILGVVGFLVFIGGIFGLYDWKYGLVIAIVIWVVAGAYRTYFGVPSNR
jgi:hypothetical protein